ncbi:unnamed protein product, partial [Prorocentrum cordatum]
DRRLTPTDQSNSPRTALRQWAPQITVWARPIAPRPTNRVEDLGPDDLRTHVWYLRHLGFEVDQHYRHLVDAALDDDGEHAAVCSPQLLSDNYLRKTFDAEQYFLGHVVAWLVGQGGMGDRWEQCCADRALTQRYPPLAHRQQLLAYVVQLGQQAVEACPCMARGAAVPGLRPVPSRPELTVRSIAGLASGRDAVAPGRLRREVMQHCVTLGFFQDRRQWTNWAAQRASETGRARAQSSDPSGCDAEACNEFLSLVYGEVVPGTFFSQ